MAKSKRDYSISKKSNLTIILILSLIVLGVYFIGYNIGFDNAINSYTQNISINSHNNDQYSRIAEELDSKPLYEILLPVGWSKTLDFPTSGERQIRYEDGKGNFLTVTINPGGRGFSADEVWEYEPTDNGNKIKITDRRVCEVGSLSCAKGDSMYIIGIKSTESVKVKGNNYFFLTGNEFSEDDINFELYRSLLESINFK